jgi:hypothetical protein
MMLSPTALISVLLILMLCRQMASAVVLLHGNKIAEVGDNFVRLFDGNHQSNTTKSRLNAILKVHGLPGESVFQKNFQWFVNFQGAPIPFFSGMRLN